MQGGALPREYTLRSADGVRVAVHRLEGAGSRTAGSPLLLVAGTFNGRHFWSPRGEEGFGHFLAARGHDVWMLDPRGHGSSERPPRWRLTDWIEQDAPAAVEAVLEISGAEGVGWVGHSAGGVVGAAFAGSGHPTARRLDRLVLLGTPGPGVLAGRRRWLARLFRMVAALRRGSLLPGEVLRLGPEAESADLVEQWLRWNLSGAWVGADGADYLDRLEDVRAPVLAVAGSADALLAPEPAVRDLLDRFGSPRKSLLIAGRQGGMSRDYNHGSLVLARAAREEVWPRIASWLYPTDLEPEARAPESSLKSS